MTPLEKAFEDAMLDTAEVSRRYNYNPTYFVQMVHEHGGVGTAKRLLANSAPQTGLFRLQELDRLDISMEAIVLQKQFQSLFTEEELAEARRRLEALNYFK
jgi:hypothetical protein